MNEHYCELEQRVMAYCTEYRLFAPGDGVVLGVSGGADSVCLLFALYRLRMELEIRLYVVHVNHGIREDAAGDAAYVESLCRQLEVPFTLVEQDVETLARQGGCSTEEAGRQVRYEAFFAEMQRRQAQKIAVAHNAGDRAETMLFHLFRGSGLTGMGSIRPVRGQIVRPLLGLERQEIEEYLSQGRIAYCRDSTNDTDAYTRNRIRRHILPYAQREICGGVTAHLCRTADIFAEIEDYMEERIRSARELCVASESVPGEPSATDAGNSESRVLLIHCAAFGTLHVAIQRGLILSLLKELSPARKDMGYSQVQQVWELCVRPGNRELHLPQGIGAMRCYDRVILERHHREKESAFAVSVLVPRKLGESFTCQVPGGVLHLQRLGKKSMNLLENRYTKWLDCDRIEELLEWRTRRTGDYLMIRTRSGIGRKTIKNLFIDQKVPRQERDAIPLLAHGSHVLWVAGGRICESCKTDDDTEEVLRVEYQSL